MKKFLWMMPIVIAFGVFSVGFDNFFVYDDFIWLYRVKTLGQNWEQIFYPDVIYFDPLIHLMFLADSFIAGFDIRWYHAVDLTVHAINTFLVYRFVNLLSGDVKAGLYGSVLFASSFAIADAVLWSSSRVDLVSVMFSLGVLIQFLKYLRTDNSRFLWLSCLMFVLALGAKGTPLILPLILFLLIIQEKKPCSRTLQLIPFGAVAVIYLVLLKLAMSHASLSLDRLHFNSGNLELAFCALFIPEGVLKDLDLHQTASFLFVIVSALSLVKEPEKTTVMLRRTGFCLILAAILPVLIISDLKLVTEASNPYLLLLSPSHRIYLASVGTAFLGGGLLRSIEILLNKMSSKFAVTAVVMLLAVLVSGNTFLVRERDHLWEFGGNWAKGGFEGLLAYRNQVGEGSQIGLINFPGSRGFTLPMLKLCLGVNDLTMLKEVRLEMIKDPEVLRKAEKSFLFILDSNGLVHDKSRMFRQQLQTNRLMMLNPDNTEYANECEAISTRLYSEIIDLIQ